MLVRESRRRDCHIDNIFSVPDRISLRGSQLDIVAKFQLRVESNAPAREKYDIIKMWALRGTATPRRRGTADVRFNGHQFVVLENME